MLFKSKRKKKRIQTLKQIWGKSRNQNYFEDNIKSYFENTSGKEKAFQIIGDKEVEDLDLDKVFLFLNRTSSVIGAQYLYFKIRTIFGKEPLAKSKSLAQEFINRNEERFEIQYELSKLSNFNVYNIEKLIHQNIVSKPSYYKYLFPLLIFTVLIVFIGSFYPVFLLFLLPVFLINTVFHYKTKEHILYAAKGVSQLKRSMKVLDKLLEYKFIRDHFKEDLSFQNDLKKMKKQISYISFSNFSIQDPFVLSLWLILEIFKIISNFESLTFFKIMENIKKEPIDKMFGLIGEVDVALSNASVIDGNRKICDPVFNNENILEFENMIHPLLDNCVPNSLYLKNQGLLLTGSNMSGKTTFVRSIAINGILAQTLGFSFAKKFNLPFSRIFTTIRIKDDLFDETSYFLKEVLNIKQLLEASKSDYNNIFILDEIFKGTNTTERIAAGKAVLSYLNKNEKNLVIVSTHDIELGELLANDNFVLYHFEENIVENRLSFDYKLKKGILTKKNAIEILRLYNYPQNLIKEAQALSRTKFPLKKPK